MIKTSFNFQTLLVLILLSTGFNLNAQDDSDNYVMHESVMVTPDNTHLTILGENLRKHNMKFHNEGPFNASVFTISTGPNAGNMIWMMGPLMFKNLDSRPSSDAHDKDWRENVMPYIKKMYTVEYWRRNDKLSNFENLDINTYPIIFVRYGEVNQDMAFLMKPFFEMVSKTIKAMDGDNPWELFYNEFRQGDLGRHVASVDFYKNWAEFDAPGTFRETFNKTIGENEWQRFLEMEKNLFTNTWDEIWEYNKYLSGK
ncbi:hypothetical protein [Gaetbulibacter aestuarii]|uniref:Uncharacterized protein n=1 Tax=Gaetbulibacter aestuarii TaxID=1502358 RepID=A0ABW7N2R6_9FLAO